MANPYYRITVKQTSRFGSSGRGGTTKNLLKNWLRTYVDQTAKQEKEAEHRALDPFWTRDGEGRAKIIRIPRVSCDHSHRHQILSIQPPHLSGVG